MHSINRIGNFFILFFCISSCTNKAIEFNDNLVHIQKSVLKEVSNFGKKMQLIPLDSLGVYNVKKEAHYIDSFINDKINKAQKLSTPKNGERLKEAILEQLHFENDLVEKIGKLAEPATIKEEKEQIETELLSSREKSKELEANIHVAQEAFAKQYQFKLENK